MCGKFLWSWWNQLHGIYALEHRMIWCLCHSTRKHLGFLSMHNTWTELLLTRPGASYDLTLATRGKTRKKAARSVRFKSGLGCVCAIDPFKFKWPRWHISNPFCYHHHQIISINQSRRCYIFPWFWVWSSCTSMFCQLFHMDPGNARFLFPLLLCSLWCVQIMGYTEARRSYLDLFAPYTIALSAWFRVIWKHWTYKTPVRYILSSVCLWSSPLSHLSFMQYIGLCVFSLTNSFLMTVLLHTIKIVKSKIWIIIHCLGLGHETVVWVVCLAMFLRCCLQIQHVYRSCCELVNVNALYIFRPGDLPCLLRVLCDNGPLCHCDALH